MAWISKELSLRFQALSGRNIFDPMRMKAANIYRHFRVQLECLKTFGNGIPVKEPADFCTLGLAYLKCMDEKLQTSDNCTVCGRISIWEGVDVQLGKVGRSAPDHRIGSPPAVARKLRLSQSLAQSAIGSV
ncbi:hypothetical protein DdX_10078 [Ditylenchus destructor]|uniref:Uncharacterized protein n=1 Tax=Ditylenchus destructor TaxID=166010 RepID=A0AAD4MZT5_9BILA|nr:hypothetical protein DdX_10078 [Ditylenchus destructor]